MYVVADEATGAVESQPRERRAGPAGSVEAVLAGARATLGRSDPELDGRRIPRDCSGYVRGLYARAGVDLFSEGLPADNGVRAIVRWIERHGLLHREKLPAPGDLVFFDNSYDRNGDRRLNDRLTHVGIVEEVLGDGTLLIVHATNHGIVREPMNLASPHVAADASGRQINAPLRRRGADDAPRTPHLMSELFAGFGRVLQHEPSAAAPLQIPVRGPRGRAPRRAAR
jgi:cell wall-associated NlpC family hydrolase